jgi:hypothetical protein
MTTRPVSITLVGWLFICVGCVSFASHTWRFVSDAMRATGATGHDVRDFVYAQISAVLAFVGGAFVLGGRAWARWLCAAWLAAHVGLSLMHSITGTIIHAVLFAAITYILFRPRVVGFFRGSAKMESL